LGKTLGGYAAFCILPIHNFWLYLGGELTDAQKKRNHRISQKRIVVENTIAQVKTFRVLYHVYRHAREAYNDLFCIVAALVNRRIRRRPLRTTTA
jgi:hypothetical protein